MSQPEKFGRYEVIKVLGQGAMGLVYKAVDPVIERAVAIKVIQANPGLGEVELERMQARFEQEFRSAGALSHSNIVTIFDVGLEGDLYYIAMEYVEGEGLDNVLGSRRVLSSKEVSDLAWEVGDGLDYAHGEGVVHRDIKPANILLTREGVAKITDFGLAKLEATTLTRTGALIGTPAYMSPEQVGGHSVAAQSDQFSLAIVLYQALTGERPFLGDSPSTIMYKIVHEEPILPCQLNRSLPPPVDQIFLRALDKAPDKRYPTCGDLALGLRQALGATPIETAATVSRAETVIGPPSQSYPAEPSQSPPPAPQSYPAEPSQSPPPAPQSYPAAPLQSQPPAWSQPPSQGSVPYSYPSQPLPPPTAARWGMRLAIALPTVALIGVLGWLAFFQDDGVETGAENDTLLASNTDAELAEATNPAPGLTAGGDPAASDRAPSDREQQEAATPEDVRALGEEMRAEIQELAKNVEGLQQQREAPSTEPAPAPTDSPARPNRDAGSRAGRVPIGVPEFLQRIIDSGQVRTGSFRIETPFPVMLWVQPGNRSFVNALRGQAQPDAEQMRRLRQGFRLEQSTSHELALPIGQYVVNVMSVQPLMWYPAQVAVRPGQQVAVNAPTDLFEVSIVSNPPGARVRIGGLPFLPTPYRGPMVGGQYEFEFAWGTERVTTRARIDRDGQEVIGRRQ